MKLYTIPTINPDLFTFWIYFYGDDSKYMAGERHFLEHLLLGTNSKYSKEDFRLNITKLGDNSLLSAATSAEFITLSGSYLLEDAGTIIELLNLMLNEASLLEDEIENERKIIVQEYKGGIDNLIRQCYQSLGKVLGVELTAIGNLDSINQINKTGLQQTYEGVINTDSCHIYAHGIEIETIFEHFKIRDGEQHLTKFKPEGNYYTVNDKISSSLVMLMYDEPFSVNSALLSSYLSSTSGPLFTELREKQQLCYAVSALETFSGKYRCPYLTTYGISTKNPELLVTGLHEHFTIENQNIFESLIKAQKINYARAKNNIEQRLAMEKQAKQLGVTFEDLAKWPTWDEFREYGYTVKEKGVHATMVVESGSREK